IPGPARPPSARPSSGSAAGTPAFACLSCATAASGRSRTTWTTSRWAGSPNAPTDRSSETIDPLRGKYEIRNTKYETNSNTEIQNPKPEHELFWSLEFGILNLFHISDFVFRISAQRLSVRLDRPRSSGHSGPP